MFEQIWKSFGRRATFKFEAEQAHGMAIKALKAGLVRVPKIHEDKRLEVEVSGLKFSNPIGVAAGFDKNAEVPDALLATGFGFTEVGTITPLPQDGNPRPRVFRLIDDEGVINRLGFNNAGHAAAVQRLKARQAKPGIVGVNIGANKDSADRIEDYVLGLKTFYPYASYFTANISSPNTPGLRDLQAKDQLAVLLSRILEARAEMVAECGRTTPVFLKIAPDVSEAELDDIVSVVIDQKLDGMIVSNTTLDRSSLTQPPNETGGLSGKPLLERSTIMLAKTRLRTGKELPVIGVGGVHDTASALAKIEAGADLVQLYTGMIYEGPFIAQKILRGMSKALEDQNVNSIANLRDTAIDAWAAKTLS